MNTGVTGEGQDVKGVRAWAPQRMEGAPSMGMACSKVRDWARPEYLCCQKAACLWGQPEVVRPCRGLGGSPSLLIPGSVLHLSGSPLLSVYAA